MLHRTEDDARCSPSRVAGAAGQGRLRRAGRASRTGQGRGRRRLRPLPGDPDERRRATRWSARTTRAIIAAARRLAAAAGRTPGPWEIQMLYGIRPDEQGRLAADGTPCASTCPTAPTGTATSCAGWPSAPPTCGSSCARSPPSPDLERWSPPMDAVTHVPAPLNEPVLDYAPGSPERAALQARLAELAAEPVELTVMIGGRQRMAGGRALRRRPAAPARRRPRHVGARHAGRRRGRGRAAAKEAAPGWRSSPSTTAPRSSSRPPTCWPARGGRR